jgi:hypothetical protein
MRKARALCWGDESEGLRPCPVRLECLEYAIDIGEKHGTFGGYSERERRYITKETIEEERKAQ